MKQIEKKLCQQLKKMEGTVLGIGIQSDVILEAIEDNCNLEKCGFLNPSNHRFCFSYRNREKMVSLKKFRRKFKKKRIDYIVCYVPSVKSHFSTFIKNSVYINRKKIYLYGNKEDQIEELVERYRRYQASVRIEYINNYYLAVIDNSISKTNFFKDIWYTIVDMEEVLLEILGEMFMN